MHGSQSMLESELCEHFKAPEMLEPRNSRIWGHGKQALASFILEKFQEQKVLLWQLTCV